MNKLFINTLLVASALSFSAISPMGSDNAMAQDATPTEAPAEVEQLDAKPVTPPAPVMTNIKPALWLVKDEDTTIYMFGTVHILRPDLGWFDEAVKTAFDSSSTLILEMVQPPQAESQKIFLALGIDQSGKTLRAKLNEEQKAKYEKAMEAIGMPAGAFDPFDPWAAAVTMQVLAMGKEGFDVNSGVETVLKSAALASSKQVEGLETMESQLAIFDGLSEEKQIKFLIESAEALNEIKSSMNQLIDSWSKPEPEKLAALMNEGLTDPEIYAKLLTNRNANWAQWINTRLDKPGTVFVAVGAGHLSGTTSVPTLLQAYGLTTERVNY